MGKKKKEVVDIELDNSVLSLVNDAFLMLDGDDTEIKVDSPQYKVGIRLLRTVLRKVMEYRRWSFMRTTIQGHEGDNYIGNEYKVLRVFDHNHFPLHQVQHVNFLKTNEYYIYNDTLTTGKLTSPNKKLFIEVQRDSIDIRKHNTIVPDKLYHVLTLGLCAELCKIDQGNFQSLAGEREADFQTELDTVAKQDMIQSNESVIYDEPGIIYGHRSVIL